MSDIGLTAIMWLIVITGVIAVITGCLYALFMLCGWLIKILGLWKDFIRICSMYYAEKRKKEKTKVKKG